MSKWKAGQIVTVHGKICRVTKTKILGTCILCKFKNLETNTDPCGSCLLLLPKDCYLKEIKPKS